MTPAQQKLALRLYRGYKTDSSEYRKLAESLGIQITDLNKECWRIEFIRRQQKASK